MTHRPRAILPRALAVCLLLLLLLLLLRPKYFDSIYGDECTAMGAGLPLRPKGWDSRRKIDLLELREIKADYFRRGGFFA